MSRLGVAGALVDGELVRGDVEVDGEGVIVAVGLGDGVGTHVAVPGLVDLQVNGVGGVDLGATDRDGYALAAEVLARRGATAVQPTIYSRSERGFVDALGVLASVRTEPPPGCAFLPAHLEGPFLAPSRRGAHLDQNLRPVDPALAARFLAAGPVGMVTLAPELDGATALVGHLVRRGVVVSLGHTAADTATVRAAVDAGARHLTHCWNAMAGPTAREPGPVGVALTDRRLTVGLIADRVHVDPALVAVTWSAVGRRLAATTDAVLQAGLAPEHWPAAEGTPRLIDGGSRLADGTLAGGVAMPDQVLAHLVELGGSLHGSFAAALAAAVDACGGAQRRLLGLAPVRLVPGERAELVVLADDLTVLRTVVGDRTVAA